MMTYAGAMKLGRTGRERGPLAHVTLWPEARKQLGQQGRTMNVHRFACAILVCWGVASAQMQHPQDAIAIHVDAAKRLPFEVPRTVFGSFLEPIGNSVYGGLWAEILQNPSFEGGLWSASAVARMIQEEPTLARASQLGVPLPWEPLDAKLGNRYELRWGEAENSWCSLSILGMPSAPTGIKQKVYLPIYRELSYHGSLYAKHLSGPGGLDISLRRRDRPEEIFAHAPVHAESGDWTKYSFTLVLPPHSLLPLEPADFVIQVEGDERVLIDQASLAPDDAIDGLDPEMVALAKEMHTPLVRFGGNFTSAYHWRDGIGPRDKRVSMLNIAWGIPEYNQFGTDEFLRFCDLIGAQPQIALNLGSGTPEEAADWVRYIDEHWNKHSGLLWELGNELWGNWNLGVPTMQELPGRTLAFSKALRSVDPEARLIATGQDPDVYQKWNAAQLTNPPGTFDFLSTHFVVDTDRTEAHTGTPDEFAEDTFALPVELGRKLQAMQEQINQAPGDQGKVHLAFTEWLFIPRGGHNAAAPSFQNMGGAVAAGGIFNMLLQHADVVPVSDMTGIIEFAGIWKKRGRVYATPAYYAFQLYSTAPIITPVTVEANSPKYDVKSGITRLPEIQNVPYLDVVAAVNQSGDRLTLFCVNRHLNRDLPATISLSGFLPGGKAVVDSLFSTSIYDTNTEDEPLAVKPAHSEIPLNGSTLTYTFVHESVTRIELAARQ
jgi:alpha-L-arabinofuranosidase